MESLLVQVGKDKILAFIALAAVVAGVLPVQFAEADHDPFGGTPQTSVTICHSGNGKNFTSNSPSISATGGQIDLDGGHQNHSSDIIPPFHFTSGTTTLSYAGQNWTTDNQTIWNSGGCNGVVATTTPTGALIVQKVVVGTSTNPSAFSFQVDGGATGNLSSE